MADYERNRKLAFFALFLALALILSYVESLIPFYMGVPGMKVGLTNLVVVVLLYLYGGKEALLLNILRIILAGLLFGNLFSIVYSLAGGLLSFCCMWILKKTKLFSVLSISITGGIAHNLAQNLVAAVVFQNHSLLYYFPVLLAAGALCGGAIGAVAGQLLPRLEQILKQSNR